MGRETWVKGLQKLWTKITGKPAASHMSPEMMARHQNIRSRVHFAKEMPVEAVVDLLRQGALRISWSTASSGILTGHRRDTVPARVGAHGAGAVCDLCA
ncbi:hypothetical protein RHE_CH02393 [Rhizobium etli CFN 42]|uniref:Uncharacterized protein n=1 Tax=Rhizobium etli (strain ATCC 51251 / DSM 11541 / JCM 21823 / NBRC 15573 / CFN 42) TaxID=347834 RepID=Q2K7L3_RHIEC|nr:hypothetical protein RHE_CH02393 [Rhizobium etli CFN 42]